MATATATLRNNTVLAATAPVASGAACPACDLLNRANVSVTLVDDTNPPSSPVIGYPAAPAMRCAM